VPTQKYAACLALALLAIVTILRLPTLFRSVMDWDESLYIVMADQWLAGHLPYTVVWDNKPIGIYAIFAFFEILFRGPVLAIRAATILFVSLTALALHRLTKLVLPRADAAGGRRLATLAAGAFILGSLSNDGLSANTETFMECFSVLAILAAIDPVFAARWPVGRGFCLGLLFGLACMTKYVAVFEAPAIGFALLFFRQAGWGAAARKLVGAAGGALLVPAVTMFVYAVTGHFGTWWQCSIASNLLRVAASVPVGQLHSVMFIILPRWLPMVAGAACLVGAAPAAIARILRTRRFAPAQRAHALLILWLAGGALGLSSAKSFYDHYFLQILPVSCLCLVWAVAWLAPRLGAWPAWRSFVLFAALLAIPGAAGFVTLANATQPLIAADGGFTPDVPARVAADLRPALAAAGTANPPLYVFDSQPILYALTRTPPPTRYVLPSVLTGCFLARIAGVDAAKEVERILGEDPLFIVSSDFPPTNPGNLNHQVYAELNAALNARYSLWRHYPDTKVYRLRPNAPSGPMALAKLSPACGD